MKAPAFKPLACSIAVGVLLLQACAPGITTELYVGDRERQAAELSAVQVVSVQQPPGQSVLAERFEAPDVYQVEDLTLHAYELDYEELKALHAEMREVTGDEGGSNGICKGAECLFLPLTLPFLIMDAPFAVIGVASEERKRARQIERLTGRLLVFAYDAEGNYRWNGCCFYPVYHDNSPVEPRPLPHAFTVKPTTPQSELPASYRADYWVMQCHRAKSGDRSSRFALFNAFNRVVPDPVHTYYWARLIAETAGAGDPSKFLGWVEKSLPADQLKAGEAYYLARPIESVDCREVAQILLDHDHPYSFKGPNVGAHTGLSG